MIEMLTIEFTGNNNHITSCIYTTIVQPKRPQHQAQI